MRDKTREAIGAVVEGAGPLCKVALVIHDDRAWCSCCGDSYVAASDRLDVMPCPLHVRFCQHWEAIWIRL